MSKVIKQSSCPNCGSSDANTLYEDGHWYCFSCQHYTPPERNEMDITKPAPIQGVVQTNFTKGEKILLPPHGSTPVSWKGEVYHVFRETSLFAKIKADEQ